MDKIVGPERFRYREVLLLYIYIILYKCCYNRLIDHAFDGRDGVCVHIIIYEMNNVPTRNGCIIIIIHTECLQHTQPLCLEGTSPLCIYTIQGLEKLHNGVVPELLD